MAVSENEAEKKLGPKNFDRNSLDEFLIKHGCVGFYDPPLKLRSGRDSDWYADLRLACECVETLSQLANHVYSYVEDLGFKPDYFLGVPEGAVPLAKEMNRLISYKPANEVRATMLRSEPKGRGDPRDKYSVGPLESGDKVILVEDASTTGSGSSEQVMRLQEVGVELLCVTTVVNRQERREEPDGRSVKEFIEDNYGVPFNEATNASTLVPRTYEILSPSAHMAKRVESYYKRYGIVEIVLTK